MEDPSDSLIRMNHWVSMMWAQVESLFPGSGTAAHTDLRKYLDSLMEIYKQKNSLSGGRISEEKRKFFML